MTKGALLRGFATGCRGLISKLGKEAVSPLPVPIIVPTGGD
jgi:hypothetical protein